MTTKKSFKVNKSGLIADKELFRIWFEFYRLALVSQDKTIQTAITKSKKFYADWGTDASIHFDDWWKTHDHLFADNHKVRLVEPGEHISDQALYLAVPKTRSLNVAVDEVRELLAEHFKVSRSKRTHVPVHRFAPTEVQGFKRDAMRLHLDLMREVFSKLDAQGKPLRAKALYERVRAYLETERYKKKRNTLPSVFADLENDNEDAKRNVRRYKMRCNKLLTNVATGVFPGKY